MIIKYTTKRDINGNRYTLHVNHEAKTFKRDYNDSWNYSDYVTIGKRDREKLIKTLISEGYNEL